MAMRMTPIDNAGNRFRVEEYKKPEYEVTVTPACGARPPGTADTGQNPCGLLLWRAGGGRERHVPRVPQPVRAHVPLSRTLRLSVPRGRQPGRVTKPNYRSGEVVAQGKTRLDAQGDAFVNIATRADAARWHDSDLSYTVEADVQDESRRVISGTGALKATKHDVAVFLRFPHGYATQGDRVDVEVKTLNPSDQPVSVSGMARVYRQSSTPPMPIDGGGLHRRHTARRNAGLERAHPYRRAGLREYRLEGEHVRLLPHRL